MDTSCAVVFSTAEAAYRQRVLGDLGLLFKDKHGPVGGEIGGNTGNQIQYVVNIEEVQFEFRREKMALRGRQLTWSFKMFESRLKGSKVKSLYAKTC